MYQIEKNLTTISVSRVASLPALTDRLLDAGVVLGVALLWGILLYLALSAAPI